MAKSTYMDIYDAQFLQSGFGISLGLQYDGIGKSVTLSPRDRNKLVPMVDGEIHREAPPAPAVAQGDANEN